MRQSIHIEVAGKGLQDLELAVRHALISADVVSFEWTVLAELLEDAEPPTVRVARWADVRFGGRWAFRGDLLLVDAVGPTP